MSTMNVNTGGVHSANSVGSASPLNMAKMVFLLQTLMANKAKIQFASALQTVTKDFTVLKELTRFLEEARAQQRAAQEGRGNCPWDKKASMMPPEMAAFMDKLGLKYDRFGNDLANNPREWNMAIQSLEKALTEKADAVQAATLKAVKLAAVCDFWLGGAAGRFMEHLIQ